ncbi:MAG: DNA polymerase III subunit gamma and tau [Propioniciclava sp.]
MDEIPLEEPDEGEEAVLAAPADDAAPDEPAEGSLAAAGVDSSRRPVAPLALYRRYRPETFDQVIGQDHVTEPLQRALLNNRVNHAYLFSGPRGCGKTSSARILARCLNCAEGPTPTPCGSCQSCRDLARGGAGSIDVIEIDAASHGGVDEARDLRERAFFAPVHSRYKIYIIDEAHMVTNAGFNALLKVVEEPPPHVKFIFATTEPDKVIGTIRSRTHHYPFRLVPPRTLATYLGQVCDDEGETVDPTVLPLVVRAGAGSVRDSLSVLDQLLGGAGATGVTYPQATALLGYTPDSLLDQIMDAFAAGDAAAVFAAVDRVIEVGQDPRRFAEDLLRRLRDLIIVAAVPDALETGLVDVAGDQGERLTTQAAGMGGGELTRAAEVIARGLTEMRGTTAPRLHLELMCARVLLPGADVDDRGIHARLDRLERRLQMADRNSQGDQSSQGDQGTRGDQGSRAGQQDPPGPGSTAPAPATSTDATQATSGVSPDGASLDPAAPPPQVLPPRPQSMATTPAPSPPSQRPAPAPVTSAEASPDSRAVPAEQPTPVPEPAAAPVSDVNPAATPGQLTTADLRGQWPQVLEEVKGRRRVTWIVLRENAQVQSYADDVLTLAVSNPGARESLGRGGSEDILRESLLAVLGIDPRIVTVEASGDPAPRVTTHPGAATGPGPGPSSAPSPDPQPLAAPASGQPDRGPAGNQPEAESPPPRTGGTGAAEARRNIEGTRMGRGPEPDEPATESRDDPDLDERELGSDELLTTYLGAEFLGEETPESR